MKTYRIHLTAEAQKKLQQVLKRLKQRDLQSLVVSTLHEQWLKLDQIRLLLNGLVSHPL